MYIVPGSERRRWLWRAVTSRPLSRSFFITGLTSSPVRTRSPMTMASLPIGLNASQEPRAKPGLNVDAIERDFQVGARQADPVNAARYDGAFLSKGLADGLPIGVSQCRRYDGQG